jgi:hypothetical protein
VDEAEACRGGLTETAVADLQAYLESRRIVPGPAASIAYLAPAAETAS